MQNVPSSVVESATAAVHAVHPVHHAVCAGEPPSPGRSPGADGGASRYREVRGLSRGLALLAAMNALPGGVGGVVELARATGIHRTTIHRGQRDDGSAMLPRRDIDRMLHQTRERGHALCEGEWKAQESVIAIGFPLFDGDRAVGAINLVMLRGAVSAHDIRHRHAPMLGELARDMSREITGLRQAATPTPASAATATVTTASARRS